MTKLSQPKEKLLVFIVAYNAARTIQDVLRRIPRELNDRYCLEVLVIDDFSTDNTLLEAQAIIDKQELGFYVRLLANPNNLGYGGNQKLGLYYAIENDFEVVALLHGDGQYAPEFLPKLVTPLFKNSCDALLGSRLAERGEALRGGMPVYKFVGNRILTTFQNVVLGTNFTELHSGYRLYRVDALRNIRFERNTNGFNFDTELCYQFLERRLRFSEMPIPTYYGDEICYVDGLRYAWEVFKATLSAKAHRLGFSSDHRYTRSKGVTAPEYSAKFHFESSHAVVEEIIEDGATVLDIGCHEGHLARRLATRNIKVTGIDKYRPENVSHFSHFLELDLETQHLPTDLTGFDYILFMDVIEHLSNPENLVAAVVERIKESKKSKVLVTTGNVAFLAIRLLLLFGWFNYGRRGILDITHKRLFTFKTLQQLMEDAGLKVIDVQGIPAPFPLVFSSKKLSTALTFLNKLLIRIWRAAFSWQILLVLEPYPSLNTLLSETYSNTLAKTKASKTHGE